MEYQQAKIISSTYIPKKSSLRLPETNQLSILYKSFSIHVNPEKTKAADCRNSHKSKKKLFPFPFDMAAFSFGKTKKV